MTRFEDWLMRAWPEEASSLLDAGCRTIVIIESAEEIKAKLEAAYEAGEIAMREKAVKVARDEGDTPREDGGNCARQDACDNVARAIRALPLSGAEESKK